MQIVSFATLKLDETSEAKYTVFLVYASICVFRNIRLADFNKLR